jgi:hypothetical protein
MIERRSLADENITANLPVEKHQLAVNGHGSPELGRANAFLERGQPGAGPSQRVP